MTIKERVNSIRAGIESDRARTERELAEREAAALAQARKDEQDAIEIERVEQEMRVLAANAELATKLETMMSGGAMSGRIPTVAERHEWTAEEGASIHAIAKAAATTCEPWLTTDDDIFRPAVVTDPDGTQRRAYCPEQLVAALCALQALHDRKVRAAEDAAAAEKRRIAELRVNTLAGMSDDDFAAMIRTQEKLEA